jgi:hypothetical protein
MTMARAQLKPLGGQVLTGLAPRAENVFADRTELPNRSPLKA